ncbi:hypothetical protein BU17DRAFT_90952 [Hysterangium stoloniferum]|nr:hypothetical protein BU17DRAFT_90952 [Hysterangium stoloniferum]
MPAEKLEDSETGGSSERSQERDADRDKDKNGSKTKGGSGQAQAKAKDLSHVPCKFFKLGQCTAGSSCPFSHSLVEPGQQKDVCQWFLKGNCKFGHKCALAHILPGQPMSMDRKNKKAAQQAAAAAGGGVTRGERRKTGGSNKEESLRIGIGRGLGRGAAPISISKATISPSAPAPPLRDTDFPYGLPGDFTQPIQSQAQVRQVDTQPQTDSNAATTPAVKVRELALSTPSSESAKQGKASSPPQQDTQRQTSPLPLSRPNANRGFSRQNGSGDFGFGPIGSPPRSSPGHTPISQPIPQPSSRINGFSPSTSPNSSGLLGGAMPSTSPFSAPGSKSLFMAYSLDRDASASTQIKASATSVPMGAAGAMSLGGLRGWDLGSSALGGVQIEEDDLEEFLPSSLNELLTDEERKRRLSRTGGQRPVIEPHHRYSRSVPAASLMDNVKSLWNENGADMTSSAGLSPSYLGTSNVSTGFLPRRPSIVSARTFSDTQPMAPPNNARLGFNVPGSPSTSGFISPPMPNLFNLNRASSQSHTATATSQHFDLQQPRPIPGAGQDMFSGNPLSPSARALQEHAPGQSLPQGLAAGLSRIHIRPPVNLGTSTSPHHNIPGLSSGSPNSRAMGLGMSSGYSGSEYTGVFPGLSQASPSGLNRDPFERMPLFGTRGGGMGNSGVNTAAPAVSNSGTVGVGFRRQWSSHPLSSPLSGPVISNDDDDELFTMDAMDEPPN